MKKKDKPPAESNDSQSRRNPHATRETVESIVVAVILAFLFRAFVAEAFVIPTGSMAPTLYGRNKDVVCFQCGYSYAAGASAENDRYDLGYHTERPRVAAMHCPICRVRMPVSPTDPNHATFTGDRILVSKFSYDLFNPARFDVIVFKYPGNAKQNYIKRLIGLPNEALIIEGGNIYTAPRKARLGKEQLQKFSQDHGGQDLPTAEELRLIFEVGGIQLSSEADVTAMPSYRFIRYLVRDGERMYGAQFDELMETFTIYGDRFVIARKPPHKIKSMLQIVDDTKHVGGLLQKIKWPSRWQDWSRTGAWQISKNGQMFQTVGDKGATGWLRYRHLAPSAADWEFIKDKRKAPPGVQNRLGRLIDDYYAYNDFVLARAGYGAPPAEPMHWVGDLAVECSVEILGGQGALLLDLVEGGAHYVCRIDVATGVATLSIQNGEAGFQNADGKGVTPQRTGKTSIRGSGTHHLRLANVDDQLTLWVDDRVIEFDGPTAYRSRQTVLPQWSSADAGDAEPVGVGAEGAALRIRRLRVLRDIYYIATDSNSKTSDYAESYGSAHVREIFATPQKWNSTQLFRRRSRVLFCMGDNQFFPLGDNSPHSKDARMWGDPPYVERDLLIGKAVLIYWPHPWATPLPYFPNFQRMGLIR